jgi:hypothetical protein
MKSLGIALVALGASSALARPIDVENDARWLVLDGLAMPVGAAQDEVRIGDLRTRDLPGTSELSAVCGTADFGRDDEGSVRFVVLYARDSQGGVAAVSSPFFYDATVARSADTEDRVAQDLCGTSAEGTIAAEARR